MLIIIESPNKISKIREITSQKVEATVGHFTELSPIRNADGTVNSLAVNSQENYKPNWAIKKEKVDKMGYLKNMANGEDVVIATDPDREGYAIGYFIYSMFKDVAKSIYRAEFHEITPSGIKKGLENAVPFEKTNFNYYQAFLCRACSDRMIGFILSPKLKKGMTAYSNESMSAGRVQTPALLLITTREDEIDRFNLLSDKDKLEYQVIGNSHNNIFKHIIEDEKGTKEKKFATYEEIMAFLGIFGDITQPKVATVKEVYTITKKVKPPKPYTTSKLLKDASRKLKLKTKEVMDLAQQLFEKGLITYHRTDSEFISEEFINEAQSVLEGTYSQYEKRAYTAGSKSQAEAHEGIRITHMHNVDSLPSSITPNTKLEALYRLILQNSILSQMKDQILEEQTIIMDLLGHLFRIRGSKVIDNGFKGVFLEEEEDKPEAEVLFNPDLYQEGNNVEIVLGTKEIKKNAPKRYYESDFVEVLEKTGIGRPSTYATYIPTLLDRGYITVSEEKKNKGEIVPTRKGRDVISHLRQTNDDWILDLNFTSHMEKKLDQIAKGEGTYPEFMKEIHSKLGFEEKTYKDQAAPPSEKQLAFAEKIATSIGKPLPEEAKQNWKACSDFITKNKDKMFAQKPN